MIEQAPTRTPRFPLRKAKSLPGFKLHGSAADRLVSIWHLYKVTFTVTLRHVFGRPSVSEWTWTFETANAMLREQMKGAFERPTAAEGRALLDALQFNPSEVPDVERQSTGPGAPPGEWFVPRNAVPGRTMLYLHGGGYGFYGASYGQGVALVAETAGARTFCLNYRLAPEHPHPAQLEDAVAAYRWLLSEGVPPNTLVIAGDSAGGHLMIMLLVELKRLGLPFPALGVGLCPWTDTGDRGESLFANNRYDWVQGEHTRIFSRWYHGSTTASPAQTSLFSLDLRGLPPLYLQAGGREILVDMIREFSETAKTQGVDVNLDIWDSMTHDFQFYGNLLPESREALIKIGAIVDHHTGG